MTLWDGSDVWLITRYDDARFVLGDRRFSADLDNGLPALSPARARPRRLMSRMDDPRHGEIRRLLADEFVASRADALRPAITEIVETQLDRLLAMAPPVDLHAAFALPVPSRLVGELLGVPRADQRTFQECTAVLVSRTATKREFSAADDELYALCARLVAERERKPIDDLLGRLVAAGVSTGRLTREEACLTTKLLIVGGHETTANMISMGALTMMLDPAWPEALRERPDLVPNAVEELLRYHTPMHDGLPRVATEDVMVGETLISAGDGVIVSLVSGNRDAAVFADPDRLDIHRPEARRHLAFGHGIHNCLGKWIARAELRVALPALARRVPTLAIAVPFTEISFREDSHIYGVHALPVTW
ncbi:MAG TPA: cytochrome P450 [Nonomuraea sp.]|nr:cytochrome P450 [Nonomuraea sp.]